MQTAVNIVVRSLTIEFASSVMLDASSSVLCKFFSIGNAFEEIAEGSPPLRLGDRTEFRIARVRISGEALDPPAFRQALIFQSLIRIEPGSVFERLLVSLIYDYRADEHMGLVKSIIFNFAFLYGLIFVVALKVRRLLLLSLLVALMVELLPVDATLCIGHVTADDDQIWHIQVIFLEHGIFLKACLFVDLLTKAVQLSVHG
ncbi:hypothetical protein PTTW11_01499 [Pyrenophora teres f. teres]|uniref:Uncharacterized protein n=1 Tax=Pyrenophora teres f. teres TaxID=97479 RepID=A0A6S6VRD5_9PLEO|nr:hypothetical protein PTTW11_01499 [Pyrenophora teres f. teres]